MKSSQFFKKQFIQHAHCSAHHTHLSLYISHFHFLSFLLSRVSQAICSRENSLEHVDCRTDWMLSCACWFFPPPLLFSTPLTPFLLLVCPSGLSFLFRRLLKMNSGAGVICGSHCSHKTLATISQLWHQTNKQTKKKKEWKSSCDYIDDPGYHGRGGKL